jgi:type III pantothenate kinase
MQLAIDIGNTRIKTGLFDNDELVATQEFLHVEDFKAFLEAHEGIPTAVCSVRYAKEEIGNHYPLLQKALILDHKTPIPLALDYETPETLGMDRLAAALGAQVLFPNRPALIIDLGTCITYDLVDDMSFKGGMIAPGMKMRFRAMHEFTAKLPLLDPAVSEEMIGRTTTESMNSGVIQGIVGEIEHHISQLMLKIPDLKVIMTGGDAQLFVSKIKSDIFVAPKIVLLGLNGVLRYHAE